jgi:phosphotransferase system HPr-like phosphotransfer protein
MKEFRIQLTSINDVKDFVNLATLQTFEIDITSGRYVIDAKSIMGIFSVDLSKPINVNVYGNDEEADVFFEKIRRFAVI